MAAVWLSGFGESMAGDAAFVRRVPNRELRLTLVVLARGIDATWFVLAAIQSYMALVRTEGIEVARRWSAMVLGFGFLLPGLSAFTGWPLGPVFYPENLGFKIGPIPFGVPLLWMVTSLGAREMAWRILPRAGHTTVACLTGLLSLLTDVNLEPLAWKYRAWWLWHPGLGEHASHVPWSNYATWLSSVTALAWFMRTPHVVPRVNRRPFSPAASILFLNTLAILAHVLLRSC